MIGGIFASSEELKNTEYSRQLLNHKKDLKINDDRVCIFSTVKEWENNLKR